MSDADTEAMATCTIAQASKEPKIDMSIAKLFAIFLACTDGIGHMTQNYLATDFTSKGVSFSRVGMLFGLPTLISVCCVAPFTPALMHKLGGAPKLALISMLLYALVHLFMAPIMWVNEPDWIYGLAMAIFLLAEPLSVVLEIAAGTCIYCSVPQEGRVAANATFITGRFCGAMLGPPLGGLLYQWGGFAAPPLVGGTVLLCLCFLKKNEILTLPPYTMQTPGKSIALVRGPAISAIVLALAAAMAFYPIAYLPPFLNAEFGIDSSQFGLIVLTELGLMMLAFGVLEDLEKELDTFTILLLFASLGIFALLLLGSPLFPPDYLWRILSGYWMLGVSTTAAFVMCGPLNIKFAVRSGFSEEEAAAQTATLEVVFGGAGIFVGSAAAGSLMDSVGFTWATVCANVLPALMILLTLWLMAHDRTQEAMLLSASSAELV